MADDFDFGFGGFLPEDAPAASIDPQSPKPFLSSSSASSTPISPEVKARIEQNKAKALAIRQQKERERQQQANPTQLLDEERRAAWKEELEKKRRAKFATYIEYNLSNINDTKGGFMEEEELADPSGKRQKREPRQIVHDEQNPKCGECGSMNIDQNYVKHYRVFVCKDCKGTNEKYAQISKTEAKVDYLLTESELNDSEKLPFWDKPNPKRSQYARMYLYLRFQLEAFAVEKWGSLDALDAEVQRRVDGAKQRQEVKFKNNLKKLRERTRTSTWRKEVKDHVHEYGPTWKEAGFTKKECTSCGTVVSYEEM